MIAAHLRIERLAAIAVLDRERDQLGRRVFSVAAIGRIVRVSRSRASELVAEARQRATVGTDGSQFCATRSVATPHSARRTRRNRRSVA